METSEHQKMANNNLDERVEHILISKTKMLYSIIVIMVPILGFFFKIQLDITLIKENHEAHMEAAILAIANLEKEQSNIMVQLNLDHDAIIRLLQMHE